MEILRIQLTLVNSSAQREDYVETLFIGSFLMPRILGKYKKYKNIKINHVKVVKNLDEIHNLGN